MKAYLKAREFIKTHRCAECGACLNCERGEDNEYSFFCMRDPAHKGFEAVPQPKESSWTEMYRSGGEVPVFIQNKIERREKMTNKLAKYEGKKALTETEAKEIVDTLWGKAPFEEKRKAIMLCRDYRLNPLMKHVYLIPFWDSKAKKHNWVVVLGINATRAIARQHGRYGYVDGPRVMTEGEQESILGEKDTNNIWAITVVQDEYGLKAPGYGNWPKGKDPHGMDKGNTKQNMAFIRSERNALEKLFPGMMPERVEVVPEEAVPTEEGAPAEKEAPATGEAEEEHKEKGEEEHKAEQKSFEF